MTREARFAPRTFLTGFTVIALAGAASYAGSTFITAAYPDRPMPRDLLFEALPYVSFARYLTAAALVAGFVLFAVWALRECPERIPVFVAVFGLMYLLRSVLMVLTPLASPYGDGSYVFPMVQNGMFPSGHAGASFLLARLVPFESAPQLRRVLMGLSAVVCLALIVSRGHYSIDVAGGVLLSYFVEQEWRHGSLFAPLKRSLEPSAN